MMWWVCLALAIAGEPDPSGVTGESSVADEDPAPTDAASSAPREEASEEAIYEEITVYDVRRIEAARDAVIDRVRDAGYVQEIRREGRTVLRHPAVWKGEVVLWDDGRVNMKRQPIQFDSPIQKGGAERWLACVLFPLCIRPGGQLVSPRKLHHQEERVWRRITPEVRELGDTIASAATELKVEQLPDLLQALWDEGTPLSEAMSDVPLSDPAQRRTAILAFWDTRTDTPWGEQVRAVVEGFLRAVVQQSEHPVTAEELAAFNATRRAQRPLSLRTTLRSEGLAVPEPAAGP